MVLAAPATAAVVTVLLAGLAGPAAGGGQPGTDHTPAASGLPAAALGTVTLASHDIDYGTEPRPAVSASSGAHLSAAQAGGASPGTPVGGTHAPVAAQARWKATTAPLPAGVATWSATAISGVACPSARECVAAGYYYDSSANFQGLLLTGHGSSWTAAKAPVPAGAAANSGASITAIACPSARECVAAGYWAHSSGNGHLFLLTMRGSSWTAVTAPLPASITGGYTNVWAVACPSATTCTVDGSYTDSSGNTQGLLLTRHRWSWTAATAPVPAGAATNPETFITGIACPSATACTAIGGYTDSSGNTQGLLLTMHDWSWTAAQAPLPAGAATSLTDLNGVACGSAAGMRGCRP